MAHVHLDATLQQQFLLLCSESSCHLCLLSDLVVKVVVVRFYNLFRVAVMPGCAFSDKWLSQEKYRSWIAPMPSNRHKARCKLCSKEIELGSMGEAAFLLLCSESSCHLCLLSDLVVKVVVVRFYNLFRVAVMPGCAFSDKWLSQEKYHSWIESSSCAFL